MADIFEDYWDELEKEEETLFDTLKEDIASNYLTVASVISFFYLYNLKDNSINYSTFMQKATPAEKKYVKKLMSDYGKSELYKSSDIKGSKINVFKIAVDITEENNAKRMSEQLAKHLELMGEKAMAYIKKEYNLSADGTVKLPDIYDNQLANSQKVSNKLFEEVKNGIIKGERYEDISEQIKAGYEKRSLSDIKKIVRTEGTAITNSTSLELFAEEGYKRYTYSAVIDSRTTDICRSLDGDTFLISQAERGINFPPMHVNCRSGFEIVLED